MIKHVFAFYVFPLFLTGTGCIMPKDQLYIGYAFFAIGVMILCWAIFKDIKSYLQKRKNTKLKKEPLSQKHKEYDILDDCVWEEFPGWFINPKTKEKFCSDCWDAYKIKKRLTRINLSQWACRKCNKSIDSQLNMWKDLFMRNRRSL